MDNVEDTGLIYYQDSMTKKPVKKWPQPQVSRPSISHLVKNNAPLLIEPVPLDPKLIEESEENAKNQQIALAKLEDAEKRYSTICSELETMEKGNRWNNRSQRETRIKQINIDLESMKKNKESATELYNKLVKDGEYSSYMITTHRELMASYERMKNVKIEGGLPK